MQIRIDTLKDIKQSAKELLEAVGQNKTFAFHGEMGVGKTTFINSLLEIMGIKDHSSSPTFSIVNEYLSKEYGVIYHFDFYRIKREDEALDIGIEEMIYGEDYCFMEWPEKITNLLPENVVNIKLSKEGECRILDIDI